MKPTNETRAFLKALSVYDNFHHIGQELASTVNEHQADNFVALVEGYESIKVILHDN